MIVVDQISRFVQRSIGYAHDILRNRRLIFELAHREFRSRHLGSGLGLLWAFVHPTIMMVIYYVVFNKFLHSGDVNFSYHPERGPQHAPFLLWLLAGLIPWFIISDTLAGGASAITDNRFLVKKVVFTISLLPIVRLLSNLPVHLFMLVVIAIIFASYGYRPCWHSLQVFYYLGAWLVLGLGWSLLLSALVPFLKDVGQVVAVILQVAFWVTPLIWNVESTGSSWRVPISMIPTTYIVQGYRESLVYHEWFWVHPLITIYYWTFTLGLLLFAGLVFARLRPHFADVL